MNHEKILELTKAKKTRDLGTKQFSNYKYSYFARMRYIAISIWTLNPRSGPSVKKSHLKNQKATRYVNTVAVKTKSVGII